jgi:hypothetical protein
MFEPPPGERCGNCPKRSASLKLPKAPRTSEVFAGFANRPTKRFRSGDLPPHFPLAFAFDAKLAGGAPWVYKGMLMKGGKDRGFPITATARSELVNCMAIFASPPGPESAPFSGGLSLRATLEKGHAPPPHHRRQPDFTPRPGQGLAIPQPPGAIGNLGAPGGGPGRRATPRHGPPGRRPIRRACLGCPRPNPPDQSALAGPTHHRPRHQQPGHRGHQARRLRLSCQAGQPGPAAPGGGKSPGRQ